MPIKKRSNVQIVDDQPQPTGLNIVAKPKQPLPAAVFTAPAGLPIYAKQLGHIAMACGETTPDAGFSVADRVNLIRTPYDTKNPQEQRYRNRVKNRATAITAMCIACTGSRKLVTECLATECPLWAFRFGGDPFRGKRGK
jgi:hypothetical protein